MTRKQAVESRRSEPETSRLKTRTKADTPADTRIVLRVSPALKKRLNGLAKKRGRSLSFVVREALIAAIKADGV